MMKIGERVMKLEIGYLHFLKREDNSNEGDPVENLIKSFQKTTNMLVVTHLKPKI